MSASQNLFINKLFRMTIILLHEINIHIDVYKFSTNFIHHFYTNHSFHFQLSTSTIIVICPIKEGGN